MFINLDHFQVIFGHFVFISVILDPFKKKYVGVQSWKAAHLPTLEIRVEQKRNRVKEEIKMSEKRKKMLPRPGIEPGTRR